MIDYSVIFPETFFISSLLLLLLLGLVVKPRISNLLVLVSAVITLLLLICHFLVLQDDILLCYHNQLDNSLYGCGTHVLFNSLLKVDTNVRIIQAFVLISGIAVLLLLNLSKCQYRYEFSILTAFVLFAMLTLISTNNLISFYLAFELMSISLYVLTCFNQDSLYSCEAGVKYLTLGSLSSCIMLYGISFLYGYTGHTDFDKLTVFLQDHKITYGIAFGLMCIFISLCFKLAIAPFHIWAPDVYQGAPTIVTAFLSTTSKVVLVALFIPFYGVISASFTTDIWKHLLLCMAVLSVLISALGALRQQNLKRLFAYSSIGHMGHIFAVLSVSSGTHGVEVILGVVFYLMIYIVTNIGLFAYLVGVDDDHCVIENLSGICKVQPILAFCLAVLLFSMSGIPPLAGFFVKLYIYKLLIASNFIKLTLILIAASIISCCYYLNIIRAIYFDRTACNNPVNPGKGLSSVIIAAMLINALLPLMFLY